MPLAAHPAPTAEEINALPEHVRAFIHDLETNADPAGTVRELVVAKETIWALERVVAEQLRALDYMDEVRKKNRILDDQNLKLRREVQRLSDRIVILEEGDDCLDCLEGDDF